MSALVEGVRPATFDELVCSARTALDAYALEIADLAPGELAAGIADHQALSRALLRLARVILAPPLGGASLPTARVLTPERQLEPVLCRLEVLVGDPVPDALSGLPSVARLGRACRCLGAAADLLATHRDAAGRDRSPESCRLRHPAFLGFALREWNQLLARAGELAVALSARAEELGVPQQHCRAVTGYPTPLTRTGLPAGPRLAVTVARPGGSRNTGRLGELAERLAAMRRQAWQVSSTGEVSVAAMLNLAAVGSALNAVVARLARVRSDDRTRGAEQVRLAATAADAANRARAWVRVRAAISPLRSWPVPCPSFAPERRAVGRLLSAISQDARRPARQLVNALAQLAAEFGQVADWQLRALRMPRFRASLVRGEQVLSPRPPQVGGSAVRTTGSVVLRRVEEAYRAVATCDPDSPGAA